MTQTAIRSRRVLIGAEGDARPATLLIHDGKFEAILSHEAPIPAGAALLDAGNEVVMAGIVDTHAHINEPGRTDWEGFQTATRAAAAGGITTVVDMPLNSIPATTTLAALKIKAETAAGKCTIDYGFWGGVVPGNEGELQVMARAGALGFKTFLIESGVDEFKMCTEEDLERAMPVLADAGVPLLVHAELDTGAHFESHPGSSRYQHYLESRPSEWEVRAIEMIIRLAGKTDCQVHIVHLSAADALTSIARAKSAGIRITVETCPHYLHFESEKIPEGATHFKCAPPIREHANREMLWQGLKDGVIDFIVSDHSPCTPALKRLETGDFDKAWGGISGLQFSLPVVWSEMRSRGLTLRQLSTWMSLNTARFAGLSASKGRIEPGLDADLIVWNPEVSFRVERSMILHKNNLTPYEGLELFGKVSRTFVRGQCVHDHGAFPSGTPGKQVERKLS